MRWFSIVHNWPFTLDTWNLRRKYPPDDHLTYQGAVYYTIKMNVPKLVRYQVPCIRKLRPYASSTLEVISLRNRHIHSTIDWSLKVEFEWMQWFSIVHYWPSTLETWNLRRKYPPHDPMRWNSSHLWYTPSSSSMSHHGWCVVDAMKLLLVQSY